MKQEELSENSSVKATRHNHGKLRWGVVDWKSLEPMVMVLEDGATVYSEDNWKLGLNDVEILESMMRHLQEMMDNIKLGKPQVDHKSKLPIMGHILCNGMFWNYHERNGTFTERNNPFKKKEDGKI